MKLVFKIIIYFFAIIGFLLVAVYGAIELGITNEKGIIDNQRNYFKEQTNSTTKKFESISNSEEWNILENALLKDESIIKKAGEATKISPRIIVSILIVEQLRLFHSEREIFKQVFAPLKILGNQSQFSWGVMGIKQDTAKEIESNLKNTNSPFYLGANFENILDFTTTNPDEERFARLTDEDDRYYSYLYSAILIKQLEQQWQKAGFPINNQVGVIATLYNIGFKNSIPKENPQIGGAEIKIGDKTYSFGGLAESFYYSDELLAEFPR
jgi:hypothetical protein